MNLSGSFALVYEQKVAWGDMDAFGHVNNVIYYRYMENARIEYLNKLNAFSDEINIVVGSSSCKYFVPVFYPDHIQIGVRVVELRNSAFRMEYSLYSQAQNSLVATGEAVLVCVDKVDMKKAAIPELIKQRIIDLEKQVNHSL